MAESNKHLYLALMAGGSGTRFWPKSTKSHPKQFLALTPEGKTETGSRNLLEVTLDRFAGSVPLTQTYILTTAQLQDKVRDLQSDGVRILAEPQARNTAPCLYWAAREVIARDPEGIMIVLPSDHYIRQMPAFHKTMRTAVAWAEAHDDLVTLGVKPTRPETGYGYLERSEALQNTERGFRIRRFVEKPSRERAEGFMSAGNYLWNGGMFVWKARAILAAFDEHLPAYSEIWSREGGNVEAAYPLMMATSIDFGVMEKAQNVVTFELDCGWDDVGSWTAVELLYSDDHSDQAPGLVLNGKCVGVESSGNIVDAPDSLVALLGVKDLIVVRANGVLMVADKHRAQDVRALVERVKRDHPEFA